MESQLIEWLVSQGPLAVVFGVMLYVLYRRDEKNEAKEEKMIAAMQAYWEEKVEQYQRRSEEAEKELIQVNIKSTQAIVQMTEAIKNLTESLKNGMV